jgi:L-threonylcarbamoyladenylate synthase
MNKIWKEDIENAVAALQQGGIILYPTDTIWGIGCDATNFQAVEKIFEIKKREKNKSLIVLITDINQVKYYVSAIPAVTYDILANTERPTTIIYPSAQKLAKNTISADGSIAIRIPKTDFCQQLLKTFGKPLVSTSANFSGEASAINFNMISKSLIEQMDYVIRYNQNLKLENKASRIIKVNNDNSFNIIRE